MKFVTLNTLVVGKGETLVPGMETTAAKCKLTKEECLSLHDRGAIRIMEGAAEPSAPTPPDGSNESPAE